MIIATCRHKVEDSDDLWTCALAGYTKIGDRCVEYVSYCKACYDEACKDGIVLYDEGEENKWLGDKW